MKLKNFVFALAVLQFLINANANAQLFDWAFKIGAASGDAGRSIVPDANGNIYVGGEFRDMADFNPGAGTANLTAGLTHDGFVAKYDENGNYTWAFQIGGNGDQVVRSIVPDGMGHLYVFGDFEFMADFDPGPTDAILYATGITSDEFVAKYDTAGNYIWAFQLGGTGNDRVNQIILSKSGQSFYIVGGFQSTVDFDPDTTNVANLISAGGYDAFVAKYDTAGNYNWAIKMGGTSGDYGTTVCEDITGSIFTSGSFYDTVDFNPDTITSALASAGGYDIFVAKYDTNGNYLSAFNIGGIGDDGPRFIFCDNTGKLTIVGTFADTVDFDLGPGTANLTAPITSYDLFSARYDNGGNYLSAFDYGGSGYPLMTSAVTDHSANIYIAGYFTGILDFDPGPATMSYTANSNDAFIVKYDSAGHYQWVNVFGGGGGQYCADIALDSLDNIYATGEFGASSDFDAGPGTYSLSSSGQNDIFVGKYFPCKNPVVITPPADLVSCAGDTTMLTMELEATNASYQWEVDEGTGFSVISNTFPYADVTNDTLIITPYTGMNGYMYRCIVTGSCSPAIVVVIPDTVSLTVHPSYLNSYSTSICDGDSILIFGAFRSTAGSYYDSLQSVFGCDSVYEFVLSLDPAYTFNDAVSICIGDSIFVGGAFQFAGGTYYDNYATSKGCDSTYITELILKPLPDANIGPDTLWACDGQLLSFGIDTSNNDVSSYSLGNSFNLVFDDSLTFFYDAGNPAPYVMAEVEGINGCFSTDSVTLMNNMIGNIQQGPIIVNEQFITFIATIPAVVDSFFWNFGDGNTLTGDANPTHEYTTNGVYLVCLTTTNECETDSDCIAINVNVGMEEEVLQNIIIAPNPVKNVLSISNLQNETDIAIYNALGEVIFKKNCWEDLSIDLSAYKSGLYFIELKNNSGVRRKRIIKLN